MSSDASCKVGYETVYRAEALPWRREMDQAMDLINEARVADADPYSAARSKPRKRVRDHTTLSGRPAAQHLPLQLYDEKWLKSQPEGQLCTLAMSKEQFNWIRLVGVWKGLEGREGADGLGHGQWGAYDTAQKPGRCLFASVFNAMLGATQRNRMLVIIANEQDRAHTHHRMSKALFSG